MDKAILEAQSPTSIASVGLQHLRRLMEYSGATVRVFDSTDNMANALVVEHGPGSRYGPEPSADRPYGERMSADQAGQGDGKRCHGADRCRRYRSAAPRHAPRTSGLPSWWRAAGRALNVWSTKRQLFQAQVEIARHRDQMATRCSTDLRERIEKQRRPGRESPTHGNGREEQGARSSAIPYRMICDRRERIAASRATSTIPGRTRCGGPALPYGDQQGGRKNGRPHR